MIYVFYFKKCMIFFQLLDKNDFLVNIISRITFDTSPTRKQSVNWPLVTRIRRAIN